MFRHKNAWKIDQLVLLSRQLSNLLKNGIPLIPSLELLIDQKMVPKGRGDRLVGHLKQGESFSSSLEKEQVPALFVSFIRAAEEHGDYVFGLTQCEGYFLSRAKWQRELSQACLYPSFVLILVFTALFFMMTVVLPRFNELYASMGVELPQMTQWILAVLHTLSNVVIGMIVLLGLGIGVLLIYQAVKKEKMEFWQHLFPCIPFIGGIYQHHFTHYLSIQLGSLLQSGVPLLRALDLIEKTTPWSFLRKYLSSVREKLIQGYSFHQSVDQEKSPFILPSLSKMVAIGEKSGNLDEALLSLAQGSELMMKTKIEKGTRLVEPVLIFAVGGVIAVIVIMMFLPMVQLVKAL